MTMAQFKDDLLPKYWPLVLKTTAGRPIGVDRRLEFAEYLLAEQGWTEQELDKIMGMPKESPEEAIEAEEDLVSEIKDLCHHFLC